MSRRVTKRREDPPMTQRAWDDKVMWWNWLWDAVDRAVDRWINRPRIGDTRPGTPAVFKPRDHFRADGQPKAKRSQANALAYVRINTQFRAYPCSVCQAWHVGHKPPKRAATLPPTGLVRMAS